VSQFRGFAVLLALASLTACGSSSDSTSPNDPGGGGGKTMTATYDGVAFKPTVLTSAYLGGQVSVSAIDGTRSLLIRGVNVNAAGTYSASAGNPNSMQIQWIDAVGDYRSIATGGSGTVTFTVLESGRVAGSFTATVRVTGGTGPTANPIALAGTFDIRFP
jgi:hypothetical protein